MDWATVRVGLKEAYSFGLQLGGHFPRPVWEQKSAGPELLISGPASYQEGGCFDLTSDLDRCLCNGVSLT
jgi:hypothetical protein